MTIFGVPWERLSESDVEAFLKRAGDEPLLWEAKGTKLYPDEVRRQVCGFANSHEGGYLILGAEQNRDTGQWTLDGVPFRDEARTWISNVIGDPESGVRPRPDFDVHLWEVNDRRHLAVIRVNPTPTPPCIANGTVYERIPGKTQTVRDPIRLAALFAQGDDARRSARDRAERASLAVVDDWLSGEAGEFGGPWYATRSPSDVDSAAGSLSARSTSSPASTSLTASTSRSRSVADPRASSR
jgi:hypothetical protein